MELCKTYVAGFVKDEKGSGTSECLFTYDLAKATRWFTKAQADADCAYLETLEISILLRSGRPHICKGFRSEKQADGQFVITCNVPPVSEQISRM
jgi:hypothetical protein